MPNDSDISYSMQTELDKLDARISVLEEKAGVTEPEESDETEPQEEVES